MVARMTCFTQGPPVKVSTFPSHALVVVHFGKSNSYKHEML